MVPNLLFILALRMHDDFRDHFEEDILEEFGGHDKLGPVVASLENVQNVTCGQNRYFISSKSHTKREIMKQVIREDRGLTTGQYDASSSRVYEEYAFFEKKPKRRVYYLFCMTMELVQRPHNPEASRRRTRRDHQHPPHTQQHKHKNAPLKSIFPSK